MIKSSNIKPCLADLTQVLINHCGNVTMNGELYAMAGWVNTPCLDDLNQALANYLIPGNRVRFKLAWIDKSPIATYTTPAGKTENGELADIAIIRVLLFANGTQIAPLGRMCLLQAKAAKSAPPFTPSTTTAGETQKEWAFMTSWPSFTLRAWGASAATHAQYDVMHGITPNERDKTMSEMNWFGVAPFYPAAKGNWGTPPFNASPWWTAPPVQNRSCDVPLANFLLKIALVTDKITPTDNDGFVGRDFRLNIPASGTLPTASQSAPPAAALTWDDLANQIITIASQNKAAKEQVLDQKRILSFLTSTSGQDFDISDYGDSNDNSDGNNPDAGGNMPLPVIFIVHIE